MKPIPYGRHSVDAADLDALKLALESGWLTTGPLVGQFEAALAAHAETQHCVAVNSGTAALHSAYFGAGLSKGDELVTSPLTFVATASTAIHLGAVVRFADVSAGTGNIDPAAATAAITPKTKLLVPVDYAGHPADYDELDNIVRDRAIPIIADAAHSLGATYKGRKVGALAAATALSFHPVKLLTTGEGGAVLTNNPDWALRCRRFRNHGIVREPADLQQPGPSWYYEIESLGFNYRIPDLLCALGLSQLKKMQGFLTRRREIAQRYYSDLSELPGISLPQVESEVEPAWHLFVIRVDDATCREPLFSFFQAAGLGVQLHYQPIYLHPYFRDQGYRQGTCPVAEDFASRAISIPVFPDMSDADVDYVIETVSAGVRQFC